VKLFKTQINYSYLERAFVGHKINKEIIASFLQSFSKGKLDKKKRFAK
jgi:hypothetical protein